MKLAAIFRFELGYQGRRVTTWLLFAALLGVSFLMTRDGSLAEALYDDFFLNSPFAVAKTTVVGSLLWLLVAAAVAGEAAARDTSTGMHPLTYTAPVGKAEYLGGRFLAALALNALLLLAVQTGILLGIYLPGVDPAVLGPFRPAAFLTAYGYLALPTAFAATAIQFALAARKGRPMTSYLGSFLLFSMAYVVGLFLLLQGRQDLASLLDPVGVHFILSDLSHLWTTTEKSWRLLALEGTILTNRLLWLGVGLGALASTWLRFRLAHPAESARPGWRRRRRLRRGADAPTPRVLDRAAAPVEVPRVARTFGLRFHLRQTLAIAGDSFRTLARSWAGLALLVAIPLLTIPVVLDQMVLDGVPLIPATAQVLDELTGSLGAETSRWVIVPLLVVFFAGELVWRERDAGASEITDAMPGSAWAPLLGKLLGLGLVLALFTALQAAAGVTAQAILGHRDFEIGLYLKVLFGLQLPDYLLFALLALPVHVLVDQKYIGHLAAILAYVFISVSPLFGVEHGLLVYGTGPAWSYTEMRGFGATVGPWLGFELYWAAWAVLLAVAARLFWVRGRERSVGARLRSARRRLTRPTAATAAAGAGLVLALGGFVFYNTNVRNEYRTEAEVAERGAEYERRYGQYEDTPQPRLAAAALRVEIHPERREVEIRGTYRLENRGTEAIDTVHLATASAVETGDVELDRPAERVLVDEELGHRIYALERPLPPGESLRLGFRVRFAPRGFRESGVDPSVAANGTYFTNAWLPAIGYQPARELTGAAERREHGLAARPLIPSLYDEEARAGQSGGIDFEAIVGTDADQIAVAPGALRRTWTEEPSAGAQRSGRRYFHYASDAPIGDEWAFFSADYGVREARWRAPDSDRAVEIRIYHHPEHTAHLDRTVRSIRASLDYYTRELGAYPYGHLTVVERAGKGTGMHADASLISHGEGFALWNPKDEPGSLDLPYAVVAHEMGHQWTVPYAFVEGAPVMSESLAWYYGMKVVEHTQGVEKLRRLLSFMRQPHPYAPIRRGEPLLRGLDPYMSYRRGPYALYALSEAIGEERVNTALRRLVETHRPPGAPLATTLDLYRELRAVTPEPFRPLLHDLFEVNTFWDFQTERAVAEPTGDGAWWVTLEVRAQKVVADEAGVETDVPVDEWVEVGVFAAPAEGAGELSAPLAVEKHRIRSGSQTITVTVPREPDLAGIDPYHLLDWEEGEDDDNIEPVEIER